jgi:hypothetical protein
MVKTSKTGQFSCRNKELSLSSKAVQLTTLTSCSSPRSTRQSRGPRASDRNSKPTKVSPTRLASPAMSESTCREQSDIKTLEWRDKRNAKASQTKNAVGQDTRKIPDECSRARERANRADPNRRKIIFRVSGCIFLEFFCESFSLACAHL